MNFNLGPLKWSRCLIVSFYKCVNRLAQFAHAPEAGPAQGRTAEDAEPHFDLIEPGGVGRSIMESHLRMLRQPPVMFGLMRVQIV